MNLKEFVVVKDRDTELMIWTKAQWENYERLKARSNEKTEYTCRAITTFNAGEELKEGGGMRWVKASERLPNHHFPVIVRGGNYVAYAHKNYDTDNPQMYVVIVNQSFLTNNLEWLDEYAAQFAGTREGWVSVDKELPDPGDYLVYNSWPNNPLPIQVARYDGDLWIDYDDDGNPNEQSKFLSITHWRPLPNPPNTNILKPI